MLPQKRVTTTKLISFVLSLSKDNANINIFAEPKNNNNNVVTKKNIFRCLDYGESRMTTDLPNKLKTYFDPFVKDFIRHGSKKSYTNEENMTFYYCIMRSLIPKFENFEESKQALYIKTLRDKLIAYVSNTEIFKMNNYEKMQWNKKSVTNSLLHYKVTKLILKLITDYFNINIFILNIVEDKIYVVSNNDHFDMFRYNIFLSLNNDTFESMTYLNESLLTFNNELAKKIITVNKNILILYNTDLNNNGEVGNVTEFVTKLDTYDIIVKENEYAEITESDSAMLISDIEKNNVGNNVGNNKDKPKSGIVFNVSLKMKLESLQDMAKKLNIDINKTNGTKSKPKTKNELVDEINNIMIKK